MACSDHIVSTVASELDATACCMGDDIVIFVAGNFDGAVPVSTVSPIPHILRHMVVGTLVPPLGSLGVLGKGS